MARKNRLWIVLSAVLVAAGLSGFWFGRPGAGTTGPSLEPLIVTIAYGTIESAISAPGTLQPSEVVPVYPPSTGEIAAFHVALGDRVEAGQLLATIEPDLRRDATEIRAPIAGTVSAIERRVGAYVKLSEATPIVMQIVVLDPLVVDAEVLEPDIAAISNAEGMYFKTLSGGDRRWSRYGDRLQIDPMPARRNGGALYRVRFDADNSEGELFPGMTTQVFFVTSSAENVLTVPLGALTFADTTSDSAGDTRRATVEAVRADGETERREIVVRATDRVNAEVVSGLAEGDRVVAGTILPEVELVELEGESGRGRSRTEERFFEAGPGAR